MSDRRGEVKWMGSQQNDDWGSAKVVDPKYSRVGERIRHITPSALQCSMFCGGKQCKYDNPAKWKSEEMAIKGLYSSWVTNKILATARPSSYAIDEYSVIEQFKQNNITAIMNLQHPGEHSSCGFGLQESGFSYNPQEFMDEDVFFYNFGWDDYGVRALQSILDMVKVMDFALMDGKVAIHCHAGLGRTGVLIACYFVYSQRMKADEAINKVRSSRPKAIQTRGQIACVRDFEKYLKPMWIVFANACRPDERKPFSLDHFLRRQAHLLHGEEERDLRYVPKIVFVTCQRLLELAGVNFDLRSISLLKRRGFTSIKHNPESSTSIYLQQESSESSFSTEETSDHVNLRENRPSNDDIVISRSKRNSDSGFLVGDSYVNEEMRLDETNNFRYFNTEDPDPTDYGGVEEIKPERVLRHSSSESALAVKCRKSDGSSPASDLHRSLKLALKHEAKDLALSQKGDTRPAQGNDESELVNDVVSISSRTTSKDSGITNSSLADEDENIATIQSKSCRKDKDLRQADSRTNAVLRKVDSNASTKTETKAKTPDLKNPSSNHSLDSQSSDFTGNSLSSNSLSHSNSFRDESALNSVLESIEYSIVQKQSDLKLANKVEQYKVDLNNSDSNWKRLKNENDACVICCLLWSWLEHLQEPVITDKNLKSIAMHQDDAVKAFQTLDRGKRKTLQVILCTFLKTERNQSKSPRNPKKSKRFAQETTETITANSEAVLQKVLHWISLILIQEQPSSKKTKSDKKVESSSSEAREQSKEYTTLSSFLKLLCKSDIFKN